MQQIAFQPNRKPNASIRAVFVLALLQTVSACGGGGGGGGPAPAPVPKAWQGATLLETDDIGTVASPHIYMDTSSNAIAVWQQSDGTRFKIWANRYNASTSAWGTATLIETDNAGTVGSPKVALDANGNAIAVWNQSDGTRRDIWANRYSASTSAWGTATLIETDNAGDAFNPQIAVDASGNAIAVWNQSDGTYRNIWANRYNAGSATWGTAELIETDNAGSADSPRVASSTSGNALAVWYQSDGTRDNIWASRYNASTSAWGSAALVETDNTGNAYEPQIALDSSGNATAVWTQFDGTRNNIWANRYNASTSAWGTATLIETDNVGVAFTPQIAVDASGNAIAVWSQYDGTRANIWANRYTPSTNWGTATLVETNDAGTAFGPRIATDASGNGTAVWYQSDGARYNIWTNRYTAGVGWGAAVLLETGDAGSAEDPQIAVSASGQAIAVWEQLSNNVASMWANVFR